MQLALDPIVQAYIADIRFQYGMILTLAHVAQGLAVSTTDRDRFLDAVDQSMHDRLDANFRTYIAQFPNRRQALFNRIDRRRKFSQQVVGRDLYGAALVMRNERNPIAQPRYTSLADLDADIAAMFSDPRGDYAPVRPDELWPTFAVRQ